MLTNPVCILFNANQWSRKSTFTITLIHAKYNCLPKVRYNRRFIENLSMSKEGNKLSLVEIPSTSGSSFHSWYCSCTHVDNSTCKFHLDHNNEHRYEENTSNFIVTNTMISIDNNMRYCQFNNADFTNEFSGQENLSKHCIHKISRESYDRNKGHINAEKLVPERKWENMTYEKCRSKPGFIFSIMCYNVLAQDLLTQHAYLYRYNNNESLEWKIRWKNLFKELKKFSPEILCLQEVQESHISTYFSLLETLGYRYLYKKRTGLRTDGCALYYKTDLINLMEYTTVEYFQPNISVLNRDNVGIIAKFTPKLHPTREFVVATTHLLYNPRRQDVRLAQMQVLLTEVERISYCRRDANCYLPVIITGDLNSPPDSAVYDFVTTGQLNYEYLSPKSLIKGSKIFTGKVLVPSSLRITDNCQHADLLKKRLINKNTTRAEEISLIKLINSDKKIPKQYKGEEKESELFCTGTLSHGFAFRSVYTHHQSEHEEGTTFQEKWLTVDYIFYSAKKDETYREDKLKLLSRYRLPTAEELHGVKIPNSICGSDHLSLLAKFKLEF